MKYKPKYSGESRSGVCKCGCHWTHHHRGLVANMQYIEETREGYVLGECLTYGRNEGGGMKFNDQAGIWEDHCFGYEDSGYEVS